MKQTSLWRQMRKARWPGNGICSYSGTIDNLSEDKVAIFRKQLDVLPAPLFVHRNSGKRAGVVTMIDVAVKQDINGE